MSASPVNLSALQMIHMKCQELFSLKNKKNLNVICCSCDRPFKA